MNRLGVILVLSLAIGLSVQVLASSTDWLWVITVSAQPGYSDPNQGKFGVLSVAFDEQDSKDVQTNKTNKLKFGALHPDWTMGGGNDDPYWSSDIRAPLAPGQQKKWSQVRVYKKNSAGNSPYKLEWSPDPQYAPVSVIQGVPYKYYLTVTQTQPVTGAPAVGTTWELIPDTSGFITLPHNGFGESKGYEFEFSAIPVPEPSVLLGLTVGAIGIPVSVLIRRRRA